ncbi:penicillin-binding protein 1C [Breznakiella homolactica]|uniref:peptidoglycan glycosyltransferase n=1 Tax=Breznakiella homolactica TaxID=2798577 RepID=A0A7T7XPC0_9SPIR|nr:penicillin-binding protein 1C [Breznakiella homolactica]QQO09972.1 penicillin-binding protein 1C [Breznakiella homolactica]
MNKPRKISKKKLAGAAAAVLALFLLFLGYNVLFFTVYKGISFSRTYTDRNGALMHIFLTGDDKYRIKTSLGEFPPQLIEAVLLQEDRYFYGHMGINPGAMLRAGWETYVKKDRRMGASTITMQLARLKYGLHTRSLPGKINQTFRALFLEICLSKQEILEAYLNLVPCGGNIEGYPAAAWYYFRKDIKELTLGEILTLVVIPQNPVKRAPLNKYVSPELLSARKKLYESWLAQHPEDILLSTEMEMAPAIEARFPYRALHFTEYLNTRSLPPADRYRTSIDIQLQNICERELESYLVRNRNWGITNGSILLLDFTTMEVLAAVGSADYYDDAIHGQVNGTSAKRSPGSTLKPFIYALALEQGLIHPEKMLKDTPVGFNEYTPDNYKSEFKGPVKAWHALTDSRNIPAVQLARDLDSPDLYDFLISGGITGLKEKDHYGLSAVLGSADLTMMELCSLYAALANGGIKKELRFLPDFPAKPGSSTAVLSPEAAWITLRMLERNPAPDTTHPQGGRNIPVAYKTGTSIGFKDAWSIAVFGRYVLCVWIGNFSGEGNNAFIGRLTATPLQFRIIDAVLAGYQPDARDMHRALPPRTVSSVRVCAVSGDIPGEDCSQTVSTWFIPGTSPITKCRIHRKIYIDTRTGYRTDETERDYIRAEVREFWPTDLLEIFNQAGLPRLTPPPYPPDENTPGTINRGFPPSIVSPLSNTNYVIQPGNDRYNRLVLLAGADQDSGELFWFANSLFLGRAKPDERFVWAPSPGTWDLTVVDSRGRSSGTRILVTESGL